MAYKVVLHQNIGLPTNNYLWFSNF